MPQCDNCRRHYDSKDRNTGRVGHVDSKRVLEFCGQCFGTDEAKAKVSSRFEKMLSARRKRSADSPPKKKGVPASFGNSASDERSRQRGIERSREKRRAS